MERRKATKAILYARVSQSRTADDSESCEVQDELCECWCKSQKLEIIARHRDHAISGKRADNRPGLQAAMRDVWKHKAVLVCYSLSRFSRTMKDCLDLVDQVNKAKGDFACVKEQFSTTSAGGELIFHIFAALQQFERRQLSERTSDAMLEYQANGRRMSSRPPYGFTQDPDNPERIVPDQGEQLVIETIQQLRQAKMGLREICRQLDAKGIVPRYQRSKTGQKHNGWHHSTVRSILDAHR